MNDPKKMDPSELYIRLRKKVRSELKRLRCPDDAVDDFFHDAFYQYYQLEITEQLKIGNPAGYIHHVARIKFLLSRKKQELLVLVGRILEDIPEESFEQGEEAEFYALFIKHMQRMDPRCIEILEMYFSHVSEKEIKEKMGLKNINMAKDRKRFCKEKLRQLIQLDPIYSEINGRTGKKTDREIF